MLGSADRREELQELLALEAGRAAEARGAIAAFQRELLEEELAGARDSAENIAATFEGVVAILDRCVGTSIYEYFIFLLFLKDRYLDLSVLSFWVLFGWATQAM